MLKIIALLALGLLLPQQLLAKVTPSDVCRVTWVNEKANFLEEGLVKTGHGDSDSQSFRIQKKQDSVIEVKLGQGAWSHENGDVIISRQQGTAQVIKVNPEGMDLELKIMLYPSMRGIIFVTQDNKPEEKLAALDCLSVKDVEMAQVKGANSKKLNPSQILALPERTRSEIESVDVPFELSDGYYDIKSTALYQISSKANPGLLVGYVKVYELSYTEGDDLTAIVRFDRNGLRISGIE
ncbi:MAG: hypothetical protein NTV34_16420 [Proteobacteria bacterium]|nr:hypothetical protein [Pseudomonadota bacterium]